MDDSEKLTILMKEYDTLRTEILQRSRQRFAFLGLIGAGAGYVLFKATSLKEFQILGLTVAVVLMACIWMQLGNIIVRCSNRLAEIEIQVNQIAGEDLLKWEHEKRGSKWHHRIHG